MDGDIGRGHRTGPILNPVDTFGHLPEPTRKWLESLREDDLSEIVESVQMMRQIRAFGRVTKWIVLTSLAIFLGIVAIGEGILKVLGWIARGGQP